MLGAPGVPSASRNEKIKRHGKGGRRTVNPSGSPRPGLTDSSERMVIFGYRAPPIPAAPARRFLRYEAGSRAGRQCADLIPQGPRRKMRRGPSSVGGDVARESEA